MNAALAIINAFAPKNEFEAVLAIQIACCHAAGMNVLARVGGAYGSPRNLAALSTAVSRLFRVAAVNIEALRRQRTGGSQFVRVEHVHVTEGGQAVIGNVRPK